MVRLAVEFDEEWGAERFISIEVELTDDLVEFDPATLDVAGRKRFRRQAKLPHRAIRGWATISWKSEQDRERCIVDQSDRGRWRRVRRHIRKIRHGVMQPGGPVYLHPSITCGDKLRPIDGTRRLMACLELAIPRIPVVVLVAA